MGRHHLHIFVRRGVFDHMGHFDADLFERDPASSNKSKCDLPSSKCELGKLDMFEAFDAAND